MVQSAPHTSKTAKKRAGAQPVHNPDAAGEQPDSQECTPEPEPEEEDADAASGAGSGADIPVKPTVSFKRRSKRVRFEIPRVSFRRLVEEIAAGCKSDLRIQQEAIEALQEYAENMLTERFGRCAELADLCKLDTVRGDHWRFVRDTAEDARALLVPCSGTS
jgi:histone H3/H4